MCAAAVVLYAGTTVSFSFSYSATRPADFVITTGRVLEFLVTVKMEYQNCNTPALTTTQNVQKLTIKVV